MKELIFFLLIIVILFIIFMVVSSKQTKEPFLQIKNNLGWGGCGLTNWF